MSEVSISKNGILALARGSHLRRVFPVPCTYNNQILYPSPEVRCSRNGVILRFALYLWSGFACLELSISQKPKEGFHYAKQ